MRLALKLALALFLGMTVVLILSGYFRVKREAALFESDTLYDQQLLGRALASAVAIVWRTEGEAPAREVIAGANAGERDIRVRLLWLDVPSGAPDAPPLEAPDPLREVVFVDTRLYYGLSLYGQRS